MKIQKDMFLQTRLQGSRFDDGEIPIDVFNDISNLGTLIFEIAQLKFQKEYPESSRKQIKESMSNFHISLFDIEPGSVILKLNLVQSTGSQGDLFHFQETIFSLLQLAKNDFLGMIQSANTDEDLSIEIPINLLKRIKEIGKYLLSNESFEFFNYEDSSSVFLTTDTRKRLNLEYKKRNEKYPNSKVIRGFIPEVDQDKMTFQMMLSSEKKLKGKISKQHLESVIDGFNGYNRRKRVLVEGKIDLNSKAKIIEWGSIDKISPSEPHDVPSSLYKLKKLEDGWLNGEGVAPDYEGLNWLENAFVKNYPDNLPLPFTYPTPDGSIQMEWIISRVEIELEINLENHRAEWFRFDMSKKGDYYSKKLELDQLSDWEWIINDIKSIIGAQT